MKNVYILVTVIVLVGITGLNKPPVYAASGTHKACSRRAAKGWARCHALIVTDITHQPVAAATPQGYGPTEFYAAYGIHGTSATNVAIVVAYDAPHILNDLTIYSQTFGLPSMPSCSTAEQLTCLKKVDQQGGKSYPAADTGWAIETSMDVETVHGMCPRCRITLVESNTSNLIDLAAAVDQAITQGAKVISNSYGGPETAAEVSLDAHYSHKDVVMLASSGDSGYGTNYPAASPTVIAVGGTDLHITNGRVVSENAWNNAGSGCSVYEIKPVWQHDTSCKRRAIADIAADANPATGAAIYDSYSINGRQGWFKVGGTSLAAPLIAGMIARSNKLSNQPAWLYGNSSNIRDITIGHNGSCVTYLCRAGSGYDGPTGLGVLQL